jgi:Rod binding domain-containing protein
VTSINTKNAIPVSNNETAPIAEDSRRFVPKPFVDVAKGMEEQFANFMVEQMRKTSGADEAEASTASEYYDSLMDTEHAKKLSQTGNGLGVSDLILDQIYPKRLRSELAFQQYQQQASRAAAPSARQIKSGSTVNKGESHE